MTKAELAMADEEESEPTLLFSPEHPLMQSRAVDRPADDETWRAAGTTDCGLCKNSAGKGDPAATRLSRSQRDRQHFDEVVVSARNKDAA